MRVVFACAGTGGHINPAIAIANIILKSKPNSEILFIGTKTGLENKLVPNAGFEIKHIRTGKIIRSLTLKNFKQVKDAYLGIKDAKKILKEFNPDLVIGTGGYICMSVMLAAKSLKIPYILHESNSYPGISVKLLSKKARYVLTGFENTKDRLKYKKNVVFTGTPAKFDRVEFEKLDRSKCFEKFGISDTNKKIVLITCGSQGAKKVNDTVIDMVEKYRDDDILYFLVTGENNYESILKSVKEIEEKQGRNLSSNIKVEKFVYNMDMMYKIADLCITRSGAMTITELSITKSKAILIPLPTAAENHQYYNAKVLEDTGYAKILEQKNLDKDSLHDLVKEMLEKDRINIDESKSQIYVEDVQKRIYDCIKNVDKA